MRIKRIVYPTLTLLIVLMQTANATTQLIDWRDLKNAPATLPLENSPKTIVILADDLDLGTFTLPSTYPEKLPLNVVLMADTLRLSQIAHFGLSSAQGAGFNLLIIVRQVIVGEAGVLDFKMLGQSCGSLRIFYGSARFEPFTTSVEAAERFKFSLQKLRRSAFSGYQDKFNETDLSKIARQLVSTHQSVYILDDILIKPSNTGYPIAFKTGFALNGAVWFTCAAYTADSGELMISQDLKAATDDVPKGARLYQSQWMVSWLNKLNKQVLDAVLLKDRNQLLGHFQNRAKMVKAMSSAIVSEDYDEYSQIVMPLIEIREKWLPPIWQNWITVQAAGGMPKDIRRFIVKDALLINRLAPTDALIQPHPNGKLGIIQYDNLHPDKITLHFDAKLTVDPWLKSLASQKLAETGEKVMGLFTHWKLSNPKIISDGVRDIAVVPIEDILRIKLTIESHALGNIALWRLGRETGLPLKLKYETRVDSKVRGDLQLALSLARSTQPGLKVNGDNVINTSRQTVTIGYVMVDDQALLLNPALTILPGKSVKLPIPQDMATPKIIVPPEAVYTDGISLLDDFEVMGGGLMTKVTLTNLLAHNEEFGGALDYVVVKITYLVGEDDAIKEYSLGSFKLSSRKTHGSEIRIPFIKSKEGQERFRIEGRAYYDNEQSYQTLQPREVDDLSIKITDDFFANEDDEEDK